MRERCCFRPRTPRRLRGDPADARPRAARGFQEPRPGSAGAEEGSAGPESRAVRAGGGAAVPGQHAGRGVRLDGRRRVLRARLGDAQARQQGSRQLPLHRARGAGAAQGRRAARLHRQPQGRRARAGRALHRPGPARARLPARRDDQVRQGRRREVHRAEDQRPRVKAQPEFVVKEWE